ncbi:MAG: PDZ domain-containing protein [Solidesulfovibrio sp.]
MRAPSIWLMVLLTLTFVSGCNSKSAYQDYQPLNASAVPRPEIGVTLKVVRITDDLRLFSEFKTDDQTVLIVTKVKEGKPADRAGVQVGDLFLTIDGTKVKGMQDSIAVMQRKHPGDPVMLGLFRKGAGFILGATLQ